MKPTAKHLDTEAGRLASVATNLIATAAAHGVAGAGDEWIAQPGVQRQIVVDLDHIITHAQALRAVFAPAAAQETNCPPPAARETNRRETNRIDDELVEAMQTIGCKVEHDEAVPYETIARALEQLAGITRHFGWSREQRAAGNIGLAMRIERTIEDLISKLPEGALWS